GFLELAHQLGDGRTLLAHRDIDAVKLLVLVVAGGVVIAFLVEHRVERDRGLAGLTVTDDQLTLAATDRDQRVNGLEAGGHRLMHRLAGNDARRLDVRDAAFGRLDRALAIDRIAERVDDAAQQALAHRAVHDRARALDGIAFPDLTVGAEAHDANVVAFEVQRHAADAAWEPDHLAGLDIVPSVDARDPVADGKHAPDLGDFNLLAEVPDLVLEDRRDFGGLDRHYPTSFMTFWRLASRERMEVSSMRDPNFTTSPPIRLSSMVTSSATSLPICLRRVSTSADVCASLSGRAAVTSAVTSPR